MTDKFVDSERPQPAEGSVEHGHAGIRRGNRSLTKWEKTARSCSINVTPYRGFGEEDGLSWEVVHQLIMSSKRG